MAPPQFRSESSLDACGFGVLLQGSGCPLRSGPDPALRVIDSQ